LMLSLVINDDAKSAINNRSTPRSGRDNLEGVGMIGYMWGQRDGYVNGRVHVGGSERCGKLGYVR